MKESGIAWIGEIPEHWQISQLRRYYEVIDCKHVTVETSFKMTEFRLSVFVR